MAPEALAWAGAAASVAGAQELLHPDSPPRGEPAQILQTVQTATGTVTRVHARAPKTWPQIMASESSRQGRALQGVQATQSMHVDRRELLKGPAAHSNGAQTDSDMHLSLIHI